MENNLVKVNFEKRRREKIEKQKDEFNQRWIKLLTEDNLDKLIDFCEIQEDSPCESLAIMKFRRLEMQKGRGSHITVEHLKAGNINIEYLQQALQELFLEPITMPQIEYFYKSATERGYRDLNSAVDELYRRHLEDRGKRFLTIALTI